MTELSEDVIATPDCVGSCAAGIPDVVAGDKLDVESANTASFDIQTELGLTDFQFVAVKIEKDEEDFFDESKPPELSTEKVRKTYACNHNSNGRRCNYKCHNLTLLHSHKLKHEAKAIFVCDICGYTSTSKSNLLGHMETSHGEKHYTCDYCSYIFSKPSSLSAHLRSHKLKPQPLLACGKRTYTYTSKSNLLRHMETVHGQNITDEGSFNSHLGSHKCFVAQKQGPLVVCDESSYTCSSNSNLSVHTETAHADKNFSCKMCSYTCTDQDTLNGHLDSHKLSDASKQPLLASYKCTYSSKSESNFLGHKEMAHGDKHYSCDFCSYKCSDHASMNVHLGSHKFSVATTVGPLFACDKCAYTNASKLILLEHMVTHDGEKHYSCDYCSYKCLKQSSLDSHLYTNHSDQKPFACTECNFRTKDRGYLKNHVRTHTGERPHKCSKCDFTAIVKSHLKNHWYMKHTTTKLSCDHCEFVCKTKKALVQHTRQHTGDKPFACNFCDYRTTNYYNLKVHVRTHTGDKPYKCKACDACFAQHSNLKGHVRRLHPQEVTT